MVNRLCLLLLLVGITSCRTVIQKRSPLDAVGRMEHPGITESSGLTRSVDRPDAFWTLNDSGNEPFLFLMDAMGRHLGMIRVYGAPNRDWETLTLDASGDVWIGDVGNNANRRRDLTVYRVKVSSFPERSSGIVKPEQKIQITYPDQIAFPPRKKNFDCEAMFSWRGALYFLTKHRSDRDTTLYKLDLAAAGDSETLTLVERAEEIGQVTGCALHEDGRRLAVLTYSGIFLFTRPEGSERFLSGEKRVFRFPHWSLLQAEGIAWTDEDELLVTNEQRNIFRVSLDEFSR